MTCIPAKRLRILWVSHFLPYPPKGGCFQRSFNLICRLGTSNDVHLIAMRHKLATHPPAEVVDATEELLKCCQTVDVVDISGRTRTLSLVLRGLAGMFTADPLSVAVCRSEDVRRHIHELMTLHSFDIVHFDTIGLAEYLADTGRTPTVMTHHGAESFMMHRRVAREPNLLKKAFFTAEWLMLRRYERRMCPLMSVNVVMSEVDRAILQDIAPGASFTVVDNGVDVDVFTPPAEQPAGHAIIFAGRLDQYANREGILFFLRQAWPLIRKAHPSSVIHVIGMNSPAALAHIAERDPRIKLHGFVPDVRPYFRAATVAICPVRDGGGTRIKILDALAQGIPTVSTTIGCEGLDVCAERDLLIADAPEEFARQIGRVFDDPALRARLRTNGRRLVVSRYSWNVLAPKLNAAYRGLLTEEADSTQRAATVAAWLGFLLAAIPA